MSDPYSILPPCGAATDTEKAQVVYHLSDLATEAREGRMEVEPFVEENLTLYRYGKPDGAPDDDEIVVNEIQSAVIAITDVQTKEPISSTLEPVETGDQPVYYWAGPPELGALFGLIPAEVGPWYDPLTGEQKDPVPLDELHAGQLQAVAISKEVSPGLPPGAIRPEWVVELNDQCVAEFYQGVHDVMWQRSGIDQDLETNLLRTNVAGWGWMLYEYDENAERHLLTHLPVTQVYIDPTCTRIESAAYAGFDLPLDAAKAKAAYPHLADAIDRAKRTGPPTLPDGNGAWGTAYTRSFKREMVVFRCFWLRNQVIPLTKEEAVELGEVTEVPEPVPTFVDGTIPQGADDGQGADALQLDGALAERGPADQGGGPAGPGHPADQDAARDYPPGVPPTVCVLAATGQQVAPGDPAWPTRVGIRQIVCLVGDNAGDGGLVSDGPCEFYDIPLLLNVDIPLPDDTPFGMGEPQRLKGLQGAESRTLTAMVEHAEFFPHPIAVIPQSVADQLAKEYGTSAVNPGNTLIMPDDLFRATQGAAHTITQAPPMSTALPVVFETTKAVLQEQSGHTDAVRGVSDAQSSGKKVELLQASGTSMMSFKAKRTAHMVRRLTMLMVHEYVRRLEVPDLLRIVSRYDEHIVRLIRERARSIEWDIKVNVQAGSGLQVQKAQLAMTQFQTGLIGQQSAREKMGLDHAHEQQRMDGELARTARMGLAAPTQGEGQPGQEKKSEPPK